MLALQLGFRPLYPSFPAISWKLPFLSSNPSVCNKSSPWRGWHFVCVKRSENIASRVEILGSGVESDDEMEDDADFSWRGEAREKDYDRDPELAEIIGSSHDNPAKAKSKMEDRLRRKRDKILHTKTGSSHPMIVKFNK